MIRLIIRSIALVCLAGAFVALVVDGTRSIAANAVMLMSLGDIVSGVSPDALPKLHVLVGRRMPVMWDTVLVRLFLLPGWLVFGIIGLVLLALSRPPAPKIGYSRR